jgi:SprT-like family
MSRWLTNSLALLAAVTAIGGSVSYAQSHERRRNINLRKVYWRTNQEYFAGTLPDVSIDWKTLPDDYGETFTNGDGTISVYLDPQNNETSDDVIETVRHEDCHIATGRAGDDHGITFQNCMKRFPKY